MTEHTSELRAIALMGPTASGKSALAMSVAEAVGCSILCCDSMQVYKGLDIGTAKSTLDEQARVQHALLDCCELPDAFSAARWAERAAEAIRSENGAGRLPLIVGGTGLYLRALTHGMADIPPEDPQVRAGLQTMLAERGVEAMHAELAAVDAETASRLHATDTQRIMRALAVQRSSGRPLSAWLHDAPATPQADVKVFVLELPREMLRRRIAARFEAMVEAGWMDEVRWLDGLQLHDTHPALRAVGYRQLFTHLHGHGSLEDAMNAGITATRHYAKRQQTWFAHQTPDAVRGEAAALAPLLRDALLP